MFVPYMHLEKFGNVEVEGIELGNVIIFPKIDGTNSSVWGESEEGVIALCAGSRTRKLSLEKDNAGFFAWAKENLNLIDFVKKNPHIILYGEWLVPHTFKGYREEAWKKFYIFDVFNCETSQYLAYKDYKLLLEEFKLEYIPPLAEIKNGSYEKFIYFLDKNLYLCPDNGEAGEGIVIKNYDYYNKFGRQCFAKIVRQEFKEKHARTMGHPELEFAKMNEEIIVEKAVTSALIEKTYAKICLEQQGWASRHIPQLLNTVFYDLVKEELWDCLKEINFKTVNFTTLKSLTIAKIKQIKPELF